MEMDLSLEGRCGSCVLFVEDHSDRKATYGHCGRKPRTGSVQFREYKCEDYRMSPALKELLGEEAPAERKPRAARLAAQEMEAPVPDRDGERRPRASSAGPAPVVVRRGGDTERSADGGEARSTPTANLSRDALRNIVAEAIDDILSLSHTPLGERWQGGEVILRPANPGLQEKSLPIEKFWRKIVMVREQLRNLERVINSHGGLEDADKVQLQQYITRCYGSLTSFNVLFKDKSQQFRGQSKR